MSHRYIIEIPQDEFTIVKQIGSGTFSDIFSAIHKKTNTLIALKVSLKTNISDYNTILKCELEINRSLHHPFICKFFNYFATEHLNVFVIELIEGITALDYVNQTHGVPISDTRSLFCQLLIAMEYLHDEVHITHRDLKLENIMIDNCFHIRLIDFGFSTKKTMMSTLCGSIPYMAPEVLSSQQYTKSSDVWSMGIILYALHNGNLPFFHQNTSNLAQIIINNDVKFKQGFDENLKDLLLKMLMKNPDERIQIAEIKNHPFLEQERLLQIDYKKLFSPTFNLIHSSQTIQNIKPIKPLTQNTNLQVKKSDFFRIPGASIDFPQQKHQILHEKITLKTDDVDVSIENRKNFTNNLTKLIDYELLQNLPHSSSTARGYNNLTLTDGMFSLSANLLAHQNIHSMALTAKQPGTSDHLNSVKGRSHHYVLTNRFSDLMKSHDYININSNKNEKNGKDESGEQNEMQQFQLQHSPAINKTYTSSRPQIIKSFGLQQQNIIKKVSNKRHSINGIFLNQVQLIQPFDTHSKKSLNDE